MMPNVLLISVDTLRADKLGVYGSKRQLTPNIDKVAFDGIVVDKYITSSPWTRASFGTLFTSLYPEHHGGHQNIQSKFNDAMDPQIVTMAEIFDEHGYETAAFQSNGKAGKHYGFAQGFDTWLGEELVNKLDRLPYARADRTFSAFARWFKSHKSESFFAWINFMDAHMPYAPPARYRKGIVDEDYKGPIKRKFANYRLGRTGTLTKRDRKYVESLYDAEVKHADDYVGKTIHLLRESKNYDNTVVVIVSDHGEEFWDHGRKDTNKIKGEHNWGFGHGQTLYDELIRVPFIIRYPPKLGVKGKVTRIRRTLRELDFLPTILDIIGIPAPSSAKFDGRSIIGVLTRKDNSYKTPNIYLGSLLYGSELKGIRTDRYKLIYEPSTGNSIVFDLSKDPGETIDISVQQPRITAGLMADLSAWMAEH